MQTDIVDGVEATEDMMSTRILVTGSLDGTHDCLLLHVRLLGTTRKLQFTGQAFEACFERDKRFTIVPPVVHKLLLQLLEMLLLVADVECS